jgi:hypothetical protein
VIMKNARIFITVIVLLSSLLIWAENEIAFDLKKRIESTMSSSRDFSAQLTVIKNIGLKFEDQEQYCLFRRDAEGLLLLLQLKPEPVKGRAYLLKNGELWLYNPYARTFMQTTSEQHISDAACRVSDIAAWSFIRGYTMKEMTSAVLGSCDAYIIELSALDSSHPAPRLTLWIEKRDYLPLKLQVFNKQGMLERTVFYHKFTRIEGEIFPVSIYVEDAAGRKRKTQLIFSRFDIQSIPDFVFTRAYVEEINKE